MNVNNQHEETACINDVTVMAPKQLCSKLFLTTRIVINYAIKRNTYATCVTAKADGNAKLQ